MACELYPRRLELGRRAAEAAALSGMTLRLFPSSTPDPSHREGGDGEYGDDLDSCFYHTRISDLLCIYYILSTIDLSIHRLGPTFWQ